MNRLKFYGNATHLNEVYSVKIYSSGLLKGTDMVERTDEHNIELWIVVEI